MIWTIIVLIVAVALFLFGGLLFKHDAKSWTIGSHIARKSLKVIAIILLVLGLNRLGLGTTYYLTKANPGILQEMANGMQAAQTAGTSKEVKKYVKSHASEMIKNAPVLGNVDATKTIFLWSDYSCGYCKRVHGELMRVLADRDDVRVVLKNFSIHGVLSDWPAKATIAAKIQDNAKAAALDKAIMDEGYMPSDLQGKDVEAQVKKNVLALAKKVGLDVAQLEKDVNGSIVSQEMAQVRDLANRFQIGGTPFLIVGDQAFPGAIPYEQIVDALR